VYVLPFTLATSVATPVNHNEHMYISAIDLLKDHDIYSEFSFLQMPLYPYFLYVMTIGFKSAFGLFSPARVVIGGLFFTSCLLVYFCAKKVTKSTTIGVIVVLLFTSMPMIQAAFREVSNYGLAVTLSLVVAYLLIILATRESKSLWFLCGLTIGLLVNVKLYYVTLFVVMPITVFLFVHKKYLRSFVFFLLGFGVGMIPTLIFILKDQDAFIYNNVTYHKLNTAFWASATGSRSSLIQTILQKIILFSESVSLPAIVPVLVLLCTWAYFVRKYSSIQIIFMIMASIGITTCFVLTPMHIQYLAFPFTFLSLLMAFPLKWMTVVSKSKIGIIAIGVVLLFQNCSVLISTWKNDVALSPLSVYQGLKELSFGDSDSRIKAATLSPIFAIEAGLDTYSQLSSGPFNFRLGSLLQGVDINQLIVPITSSEIESFLKEENPPFIIVGGEEEYDPFFVKYAVDNQYELKANFQGVHYYANPLLSH